MAQTSPPHSKHTAAMAKLALSMFLFGTIGIFVRYIPLPSSFIALVRSMAGLLFLLGVSAARHTKPALKEIGQKLPLLALSGILIGINWILLFEAYRYTTVATATLCYYLAPIFLILASPIVLRERLTGKKLICAAAALMGMVFVSGVLQTGFSVMQELKGVLLGTGAALLYASVVLLNKKTGAVAPVDRTMVQMAAAAIVLLPYVLLTEKISTLTFRPLTLLLMLVVGVVHTGFAYLLYFGSIHDLSAHTLTIFSYIDPIVSIALSALLLHEPLSTNGVIGAVLILGAALISQLPEPKNH